MTEPERRHGPWRVLLLILIPAALVALAVLRMTHFQPWMESLNTKAVEQVLREQDEAWNRGDLEEFMKGYWHSPDLTFYSSGGIEEGWDQTYERYRKRYQAEGKEMGQLSFSDQRIDMVSSDTAFVRGRWQLKLSQETIGGLFTLILKRKPEGWRIVHDHTSKDGKNEGGGD